MVNPKEECAPSLAQAFLVAQNPRCDAQAYRRRRWAYIPLGNFFYQFFMK